MFVASLSYATNCIVLEKFPVNTVSECVDSLNNKVEIYSKPLDCAISTTSTVTSNPDGSITRTTTTNVSCDSPQELAQFHAFMASIGMGV